MSSLLRSEFVGAVEREGMPAGEVLAPAVASEEEVAVEIDRGMVRGIRLVGSGGEEAIVRSKGRGRVVEWEAWVVVDKRDGQVRAFPKELWQDLEDGSRRRLLVNGVDKWERDKERDVRVKGRGLRTMRRFALVERDDAERRRQWALSPNQSKAFPLRGLVALGQWLEKTPEWGPEVVSARLTQKRPIEKDVDGLRRLCYFVEVLVARGGGGGRGGAGGGEGGGGGGEGERGEGEEVRKVFVSPLMDGSGGWMIARMGEDGEPHGARFLKPQFGQPPSLAIALQTFLSVSHYVPAYKSPRGHEACGEWMLFGVDGMLELPAVPWARGVHPVGQRVSGEGVDEAEARRRMVTTRDVEALLREGANGTNAAVRSTAQSLLQLLQGTGGGGVLPRLHGEMTRSWWGVVDGMRKSEGHGYLTIGMHIDMPKEKTPTSLPRINTKITLEVKFLTAVSKRRRSTSASLPDGTGARRHAALTGIEVCPNPHVSALTMHLAKPKATGGAGEEEKKGGEGGGEGGGEAGGGGGEAGGGGGEAGGGGKEKTPPLPHSHPPSPPSSPAASSGLMRGIVLTRSISDSSVTFTVAPSDSDEERIEEEEEEEEGVEKEGGVGAMECALEHLERIAQLRSLHGVASILREARGKLGAKEPPREESAAAAAAMVRDAVERGAKGGEAWWLVTLALGILKNAGEEGGGEGGSGNGGGGGGGGEVNVLLEVVRRLQERVEDVEEDEEDEEDEEGGKGEFGFAARGGGDSMDAEEDVEEEELVAHGRVMEAMARVESALRGLLRARAEFLLQEARRGGGSVARGFWSGLNPNLRPPSDALFFSNTAHPNKSVRHVAKAVLQDVLSTSSTSSTPLSSTEHCSDEEIVAVLGSRAALVGWGVHRLHRSGSAVEQGVHGAWRNLDVLTMANLLLQAQGLLVGDDEGGAREVKRVCDLLREVRNRRSHAGRRNSGLDFFVLRDAARTLAALAQVQDGEEGAEVRRCRDRLANLADSPALREVHRPPHPAESETHRLRINHITRSSSPPHDPDLLENVVRSVLRASSHPISGSQLRRVLGACAAWTQDHRIHKIKRFLGKLEGVIVTTAVDDYYVSDDEELEGGG